MSKMHPSGHTPRADTVEGQRWRDEQRQEANRHYGGGGSGGGGGGSGSSCFTPDTPVLTPAGWTPLADIREGQMVLTLDGKGKLAARKVEKVIVKKNRGVMWSIETETQTAPIKTSKHHQFRTQKGWRRAHRINPGDRLLDVHADGTARWNMVTSITNTGDAVPMMNLMTQGERTFIVRGAATHCFTILPPAFSAIEAIGVRLWLGMTDAGTAQDQTA